MKVFEVPVVLMQDIVNYLAAHPYAQVAQMMSQIAVLKPKSESEPEAPPKPGPVADHPPADPDID